MIIDVKRMVEDIKAEVKKEVAEMDFKPSLVIIQGGDREDSNRYVRGKLRDCEEVGIEATLIKGPNAPKIDLKAYDGVIVQQPCPYEVKYKISQDVDGFMEGSPFEPCTPAGILEILKREGVDLSNKVVAVVGRGKLVGQPLAEMLIGKAGTLMVLSSKSDLKMLKEADVIISGVGKAGLIKPEMLGDKVVIVDAGIDFVDGKICGDVDKKCYDNENWRCTSVPGGVGLMTRVMLLKNVVKASKVDFI